MTELITDADNASDDAYYVGILFSQSGTMAVTEQAHLKGALVAIDEINAGPGVAGKRLAPIIENPDSDPDLYRAMAKKLVVEDRVSTLFGCCSSASRKAVLPVLERHGAVLFYPSFYEGFEYCPNVIYGGATPNQTVIPLAEYLFEYHGKRLFLVGSDYIYPREINRIMSEFLQESAGEVVGEMYVPLGSPDDQFRNAVSRIAATAPDAVLSTVVGSDTAKLYAAFHAQGLDVASMPVASLTTSESELAEIPEDARAGHLTAACYFAALDNAASNRFRERYAHRFGQDELPSIYAETAYSQVHLFAQTVAATGTDDADMLLHALLGARFDAPQGMIMIDPDNNHVYATPKIGRARRDGGFDVLWQSGSWTKPDPYLIAYDRTISRSAFG